LTALLLVLLAPGCGDDNPTESPTPKPSPQIATSLQCFGGIINLNVVNSGGAMTDPALFIAEYEDGHIDTLELTMAANESTTCQLSNVHGAVTVRNTEWNFEETVEDCLASSLQALMASMKLSSFVSSPAVERSSGLCTYKVYINNLAADRTTFKLVRAAHRLTITFTYHDVAANLVGTSSGLLCPDFTGQVTMSSIVVEMRIEIGNEADPVVTLGGCNATINGFQVSVDGLFGFVVEWIVDAFEGQFVGLLEKGVESGVNSLAGSDLADFIIVNPGCGL